MFDKTRLQRLYRYCFALTANEADAYDLLHDGVERFLRSDNARDEESEPYLRRIIRNRFIDQYRHVKREQEVNLKIVELDESNFETIHLNNIMDIQYVWEKLDPLDREILYFWAYEGYTTREVAEKMEIPKGTILSRLNRLQHKVSTMLQAAPLAVNASGL